MVSVAIGADVPDHAENLELVRAAGAQVVGEFSVRRDQPDPRSLLGSGKVQELREAAEATCADLVVFGCALSPSQERNLQRDLGRPVIDRMRLILDIFARRARSYEGKIQVELAQLEHAATRLVRGWTHLERQKGGIGLRGPGETQIETDRRLIRERIKQLNARLERVARQRGHSRRARRRASTPQIALVGYTNSGKSTLFNALTHAGTFAENLLFATLDSTVRQWTVPDREPLVLADTVGFVRDLPPTLIAAFRSTLEEVESARLILHVVDASREDRHGCIAEVNSVLEEIGAAGVPQLEVFNKIDLSGDAPRIERDAAGRPARVYVSARSCSGLDLLTDAVAHTLGRARQRRVLEAPSCDGELRARLYASGQVLKEEFADNGRWRVEFDISEEGFEALQREAGAAMGRPATFVEQ